jgi:hypothetical protein
MGKMNALSLETEEQYYEQYIESLNQEIRNEGAAELRIEIMRQLEGQLSKAFSDTERITLKAAMIIVGSAEIK